MLNIVLFGPPGAGKGTQAEKLIEKYQLVHLSTGDIFRANLKAESELGLLARSYMDAGQLVPDNVTIQMLEAEVRKHPLPKGFIFDGFPRTQTQASSLDTFLKSKSTSITMMLALEVNETELKKRLLLRGQDSGRPDDKNPEIIQNRINVYNTETAPVKEFYSAQGKYFGVNGMGDIEDIFNKLCFVIDFKKGPETSTAIVQKPVVLHNAITKDDKSVVVSLPPVKSVQAMQTFLAAEINVSKPAAKQVKEVVKNNVVKIEVKPARPAGGKTTKKEVTKKPAKKAAKNVVKKVAKKKVAPKPTRPAGGKVIKKKVLSKKVVKKKVAPKKAAKKTAPKKVAKKKVTPKKVAKKAAKKVEPKKIVKKNVVKKAKSSAKKKK